MQGLFTSITPEQAGISSRQVEKFIKTLNKRGLSTHSLLLLRGNNIFAEFYWKPFHRDFLHRMYSQTKSFVSLSIGLLEQDKKLCLNDRICQYFPDKCPDTMPEYLYHLTIRDLLTMQTCGYTPWWMTHEEPDRVRLYMHENESKIPGGMLWEYDSPGSQVLSVLVERLSGMSLFDFLNERIFRKLGAFSTATILKTRTEDSFGDSAMLCTARDMAAIGRFVMNYGKWNGEQILNEAYIRAATTVQADNDLCGFDDYEAQGYGYQFWCLHDGFWFNGMGNQLTVCIPGKDLMMVINSDNQGYEHGAQVALMSAFYDLIVDELADQPLPEDAEQVARLHEYGQTLELMHLRGNDISGFADTLNGRTYICEENPTGITKFSFCFTKPGIGELHYTNAQGDKVLPFGFGKNIFCKFPQYGYSNIYAGQVTTDGFMYDCAVSAAWREPQKLLLKVQIIDKYLGTMLMTFSFKEEKAAVRMKKRAENFLEEYVGTFVASCDEL